MQGGKILTGGSVIESEGNFVQPTIVEISSDADVVKEELFAPVLHVMKFKVSSSCNMYFFGGFLKDMVVSQCVQNYLSVVVFFFVMFVSLFEL